MPSAISPYSTALDLGRPEPNWIKSSQDKERVTAYWTYEDIFNNVKEAFDSVLRSADSEDVSRRYVPAARTVVEATNRYLAKDPELIFEVPPDVTASPEQVAELRALFTKTWVREEAGVKFNTMKRWMLVRGDGIFHVSADPNKEEGKRLRITEIDPGSYFTITDQIDSERVVGCYIVSIVLDDAGEEIAQRIEYRRILTDEDASALGASIGNVFYRLSFYESDGWDDRGPEFTQEDLKPVPPPAWAKPVEGGADYIAGYALPADITALPVYHFRNNRRGTEPFGLSELQGTETLLAGISQTMTDEDLSMSLHGVGVYWTDGGSPKDSTGNDIDWEIAPAAVIEVEKGSKFGRVEGVGSLEPLVTHTSQLTSAVRETTATPDVAVGRVDVQVAESGVALGIQMAPIVAKNAEKEDELRSKMNQMLYDIVNGWFPAYEGLPAIGIVVTMHFADPLPVNRKEIVEEITGLVEAKVIPVRFALQILKDKLGYDIDPAEMLAEVQAEAATALDAAGARLADEGA